MDTRAKQPFLDRLPAERRKACLDAFMQGFQTEMSGFEPQVVPDQLTPVVANLVDFFRQYPGPALQDPSVVPETTLGYCEGFLTSQNATDQLLQSPSFLPLN